MMKIIDSHMHVWQLSRGDYRWLTPELPVLYRDHLMDEAISLMDDNGVDRSILVQAADSIAETDYLLELAQANDQRVAGVVGWVDFDNNVASDLCRLSENPLLIGIRPMLQDISPMAWVLQSKYEIVFDKMVTSGLVFDALISSSQLPVIIELAQRHPSLKIVLNHCAKPQLDWQANQLEYQRWFAEIETLAKASNVSVKISGLPSESASGFQAQPATAYIQHVLSVFGPERVLWGSDWPVVNQRSHYQQWLTFCRKVVTQLGLSSLQQQLFFAGNATRIYGLSPLNKEDSACR